MDTETHNLERPNRRHGMIGIFSNHPVAANLLMIMMLIAGFWALTQLNTQFFPTFDNNTANVRVVWSGASAEEVEVLITTPLEQQLRDVDGVKEITSTSAEGVSTISLEFLEGADIRQSLDLVRERVDQVRNLPRDAETPEVSKVVRYENIVRVLVIGPDDVDELRDLVHQFESDLLDRGIAKVNIDGLPQEQITIEVPSDELRRLGLSLNELSQRVSSWSSDVPLGIVGREETSRQLRFQGRRETTTDFESIPVVADQQGRLLTLGDIAHISRQSKEGEVTLSYQGKPAVELSLNRNESSDSLEAATIYREWLNEVKSTLPRGIEIIVLSEQWELLQDRINLLIKNGISGLLLVSLILYLFMNHKVAWWTAIAIPVSFLAALAVLYLIGETINMITLFAFIMALGIIVDDSIVVGENALFHYEQGYSPAIASQYSAEKMFGPVCASSLTTISAFMPLMIIGGVIGSILKSIPMVIICIIVASLIECFLILPGHLTQSFRKMGQHNPGRVRQFLDRCFDVVRDKWFRPFVKFALSNRWGTLALAIALMLVTAGWVKGGRIDFQFFPTPEADRLFLNLSFVSGTPPDRVRDFLALAEQALYQVEEESGEELVRLVLNRYGTLEGEQGAKQKGDHLGALRIELVDPDKRKMRNRDIIQSWRQKLQNRPGLEKLTIHEPRAGPPGNDIDLRISGKQILQVKAAAEILQNALADLPGVSGVSDNAPYGREQLLLTLNPIAEALGLNIGSVSRQLRAAYDGELVQELSDGYDTVEVKLRLSTEERNTLSSLASFNIVLPNGRSESLANMAEITSKRGFDSIRHSGGKLAVTVIGSVDPALNNATKIVAKLENELLPSLVSEYGISYSIEGRQAEQQETLEDMRLGAILALTLIYLVLAWVFSSYGWPFVVMAIIPFGLIGAIWGHILMDQSITVLSLFGFFGLSGIVVNDSIILIVFFRNFREQGLAVGEAIVEAACGRLRAVLLTSATTIAGLTPLLFETSLQAQFLIPMAATIAFGLAFATFMVLLLVPALLLIYENMWGTENQVEMVLSSR